MPDFQVTAKALQDLQEIGRYTEKTWGRDQRNEYLSKIDAAFHLLAQTPGVGRACDEIRPGYRKYHVGRHFIFFRLAAGGMVEIIRILHERMNVEDR